MQLQWSTATETNNQGFEIQRGTNNRDLVTVGFVKGNGTTTETQSYTYVDNTELSGTVYYRLKQLDLNGKYEYSKVVEVTRVVSYGLARIIQIHSIQQQQLPIQFQRIRLLP